ncbi:MAG: hypothetical protein ACRDSF_00635 [Pseudonocardiaceae bacterium]
MAVTAKVRCNLKQEFTTFDDKHGATIGFMPDYADDRNKKWAAATPHLDLRITVVGDVAQSFELGKAYILTFGARGEAMTQLIGRHP